MSFRVFDHYASRYDSWYERNKVIAENEVKLIESFNYIKPVVEVGVGTGFFASRIGVDVGIDPSIRMLEYAVKRRVEVVCGVSEKLAFRDSSIGTILLIVTLCFLEDPQASLEEAYRVAKPGGILLSCIVPRNSSWGKYYLEKARRGHPLYSIARFYSVSEVVELVESVGFKLSSIKATLASPPTSPRREQVVSVGLSEAEEYGFVCLEFRKR